MNRTGLRRFGRAGLVLAALMLVGCASAPPAGAPSAAKSEGAVSKRARPEVRRDPIKVEQNGASGFTVSEVVRTGGEVRRDYQQAVALLESNQIEAGIALLESVVERAPEVTIPHIDLGMAYVQREELEKAEASFQTALSLAPGHPVVLNELGILQRRTGRFEAARDSYERALTVHPGFHYALLNLGVLCDLFLEDLGCALENYSRYSTIVVDDPQVGIWIADVENRLARSGGE